MLTILHRLAVVPALLLVLAAPCAPAAEPPATELLTGSAVTEANVIEALEPPPLMRGFGRKPRIGAPPPKPRSASLLITFETNSATLTPAATKQLDVVAAALRHDRLAGHSFKVEGHADPRGTHDLNLSLSQQRAEAVRAYLVRQHAIAPVRLLALGKGDQEPLNPQDPAAPENRRVTFATQPAPEPAADDERR